MRWWLRVGLTLPLLGGPLNTLASANWLDYSAECQATLRSAAAEVDFEPWASDYCPELTAALADDPWGIAIANNWLDYLSRSEIHTLTSIAQNYAAPNAAWNLDGRTLEQVLDRLPAKQKPQALSLWDRIVEWLRNKLSAENQPGDGILERWLRQLAIPHSFWTWVGYISAFLVVAGAIAIVVNELRHAGLLRRGARAKQEPRLPQPNEATNEGPREVQLARTSLLLERILAHLQASNPLRFKPNLTHRELIVGAKELSDGQRPKLIALIESAERVVYGSWAPNATELEPVISAGEQLLADLEADSAR